MANLLKVSVIIPAYNVEEFIEECLNSVFSQDFNSYEVIVVNDGSTDDTLEILNRYNRDHPNMLIINQQNKGLSGARNAGLKAASGEYVYFCDSDDYIETNTLSLCYETIKKEKRDVLVFQGKIFGDIEGKNIDQYSFLKKIGGKTGEKYLGKEFYKNNYKKIILINTPMMFFLKEFLINNELYYKEGLIHEDFDFFNRMIALNPKMIFIENELYNRRYRDGSIMTGSFSEINVYCYNYIYLRMLDLSVDDLNEFIFVSINGLLQIAQRVRNENIELSDRTITLIRDIFNRLKKMISSLRMEELLIVSCIGLMYGNSLQREFITDNIRKYLIAVFKPLYDNYFYNRNIGIYGTGIWTDRVLDVIEYLFNPIKNLIYVDSYVKTGELEYRESPIINIEDIDKYNVDSIIVISKNHENDILKKLKEKKLDDISVGLFSVIQRD